MNGNLERSGDRCLHEAMIPLWFDFYQAESDFKNLKEHLLFCKACKKSVKQHQERVAKVISKIPTVKLTQAGRGDLQRELDEIIQNVIPDLATPVKYRAQKSVSFTKDAVLALGEALVSITMVRLYFVFGIVLYFINR